MVFYGNLYYYSSLSLASDSEDWFNSEGEAKSASEQLLREQANAFVEWLKEEGLIQ